MSKLKFYARGLILSAISFGISSLAANAQSMTIKGVSPDMSLTEVYAELRQRGFECEDAVCSFDGVKRQAVISEVPGDKFEVITFGCVALNICGDAHNSLSIWKSLVEAGIILDEDGLIPFLYRSPSGDMITLSWDEFEDEIGTYIGKTVKLIVSDEKLRAVPNFN